MGAPGGTNRSDVNWGRELGASVVVFLVALPLCMAIAGASGPDGGVPAALGLLTGIVGGIVVGMLAGAPLQVSGPAAGLTVLVWRLVEDFGLEALGVAVLLGGVLQLAAGFLGLGKIFRSTSPAVIQGMLAGIGVIIFASQFHVMVDDVPASSPLENLATIPESFVKGLFPLDGGSHHLAAGIGVTTIVVIVAWEKLRPKKLEMIPGALLAIVVATLGAYLLEFDIHLVSVPGDLTESLNTPPSSEWALVTNPAFLVDAVALAIIASAESLLSAAAVDKMHDGERADYDKELRAQGLGNMVCGFLGALPMTGVIVRSSANVHAGAKTRLSAIFHGVWLLIFVVAAPFILEMIPKSALAAILVYTGYKLFDPKRLIHFWKLGTGRGEFFTYVATVVAIVATDLLTGVALGLGIALIRLLTRISPLELEVDGDGQDTTIRLAGIASFVRMPALDETLRSVRPGARVHVDISHLRYVDPGALDLIEQWREEHLATGGEVDLDLEALHEIHDSMHLGHAGDQKKVGVAKVAAASSTE